MKPRIISMLLALVFASFICTTVCLAEEKDIVRGGAYPQEKKGESQMQWAWGEVVSVDPASGTLVLRYLDYEAGQDKELNVSVDEKTNYENVSKFEEIKPDQTVSIDYYVSPEGKNIASNISLEKAGEGTEQTKTETAPAEKSVSAEMKPNDTNTPVSQGNMTVPSPQ